MAAKSALGIVGNVTSLLMFVSPIYPTFWSIWRNKSTQQFAGLVYVATLFNCSLWVLYGTRVVANDFFIMLINGIGIGFEFFYVILYYMFTDERSRVKVLRLLTMVMLTFVTIACVTFLAIKPHHTRQLEVGIICAVVNTAMYASPLDVIRTVFRTRSVASMASLYLSIFMVLNTAVWTTYGVLDAQDLIVIIPNAVGLFLGLVQLSLHGVYGRNRAPMDVEASSPSKQVTEQFNL